MIAAIPTRYNGYYFRSRLEARWATFFDWLGLPYEYEPEGFDLGTLGRYLPDFAIGHRDGWVEIKPFLPRPDVVKRCLALSEMTGIPVVILYDPSFAINAETLLILPKQDRMIHPRPLNNVFHQFTENALRVALHQAKSARFGT